LQDNFGLPETVDEAAEYKAVTMQEEDLIDLHVSLGMAIRNAFGMHESGSKLLASCGVAYPDDTSGVIINEVWRALQT